MFGYAGKILYVDLTTGKTRVEKLSEEIAKKYIGGIGLGMRLWLDNAKAGVDPLSPDNPLVLALGPISGTMFPTTVKLQELGMDDLLSIVEGKEKA